MAEIIRMPRLSDTMEEGVIVEWHKKEGDKVQVGDVLAEVETDKATMDLESYWDGVLLKIVAPKGQPIPVEGVIAIIGEEGEDADKILAEAQASQSPAAAAPAAKEDEKSDETTSPAPTSAPAAAPLAPDLPPAASGERIKASPLARKMASERGIDLHLIKGSGEGGRIVKRDIEGYTPKAAASFAAGEEGYEDRPVSQMRKTIARRLSESKFSAPHFYLTMEIDMSKAVEARKGMNEISPVKISFNDLIIKASAVALRQNPDVNVSWLGDAIRYYKHINIGVAVAIDEGLVVPVVRFADQKSLAQIAAEVRELGEKARERKLQPEEFQGNTFTISNLGMFGIEEFTAIINPPDACILAVGAIREKPVVKDGEIKTAHLMKVTLSCDHRAVDGAVGSRFLKTLKDLLEEPVRMLV